MKRIVIFDLDGTLALIDHRRHHVEKKPADWDSFYLACVDDQPNQAVIDLFRLADREYYTYIFSGRSKKVDDETRFWLTQNQIFPDYIRMRSEGDFTPDEVLKKRWLDEIGKENVAWVVDDRDKVVKMWRDEGLTCFQVAKGDF